MGKWIGLVSACQRKAAVVCLILAACSSGSSSSGGSFDSGVGGGTDAGGIGSDGGTIGSAPLDESVRLATVSATHAVYVANLGRTKAERDAALVAFLRQQPTIEAAGISSTDNVWARFTDGTLYFSFDNGGPPPPVRPEAPQAPVQDEAERSPQLLDLPGGVKAISANSLEPQWRDVSGEIGGWLADAGYSVQTGPLTVDNFENMSDVSVLFWQTHSGVAELRPDAGTPQPDGGPPTDFAFLTSTVATVPLSQTTYKSYRDNGYLAVGTALMPSGPEPRYAITQKYIREKVRGKLAPAALVAIDSCTGAAADAAWDAAGAAQFVAWTSLSGNIAYLAFEKYFDRLLGANAATPISNPKERSFAEMLVEHWMVTAGYDLDRSVFSDGNPSAARLQFNHHAAHGDFAILRPSIFRTLNTAPGAGQTFYRFTLDGSFGEDPGPGNRSVSLASTQLDVLEWHNSNLIVKVPSPIPSGALQVAIGNRKSNEVPLTEWLIPFTYDFTGEETLRYQITIDCRLRADVRGSRVLPADVPAFLPAGTWELEDSHGSLIVDGELHDNQGKLLESWTGGGTLPWYNPAVKPLSNFVVCAGGFIPASSTLQLGLGASGDFSRAPASGKGSATLDGILPPLLLDVDWSTMTIQAGSVEANTSLANHGVSATLSWPAVTPTNLPDDDVPR